MALTSFLQPIVAVSIPNPLDAIGGGIKKAVGAVADSAVGAFAEAVAEALGSILTTLGTLWVRVPTPVLAQQGAGPSSPNSSPPVVLDPTVQFIQDRLWWLMTFCAILAVIIGGARMAWERRAQPGKDLLQGMITLVVVSACGVAVIALATQSADEFAKYLIDSSLADEKFDKKLGAIMGIGIVSNGAMGAMLVIVIGLFAILVSIIQIVLMAARWGLLVLMAGALPLAASFTSTEAGRVWFRRFCAWTLAFILYKPVCAVIYATMFQLMGNAGFGEEGVMKLLAAVSLMTLSILALPALMRFLAPMTAATAGGGGGFGAGAAVAAAALPTGAIALGAGSRMMGGAGAMSGGFGGGGGASGSVAGGGLAGGGGGSGTGATSVAGSRATGATPSAGSSVSGGSGGQSEGAAQTAGSGGGGPSGGQAAPGGASGHVAAGAGGASSGQGGPSGGRAAAAGGAAAAAGFESARRGVDGLTGGANSDSEQEGPRGSRE